MKKKKILNKYKKSKVNKNIIKDVSEPALESFKEIEKIYASERTKIDTALNQLELARLKSYIDLTSKRKTVIQTKKKHLEKLEKKIKHHTNLIRKKINISREKKQIQGKIVDRFKGFKEHLKRMQEQEKKVVRSRKNLLIKEKNLLLDINSFFKENEGIFNLSDKEKTKKISQVINNKAKLISEAAHLVNEDQSILFDDKKILDSITDKELKKLYESKTALEKLYDERHNFLKRKIALINEKTKIDSLLNKINLKENKLTKQLQKLRNK